MTFKNLFFNLQREDLKRRLGSVMSSVLAFFIFLPVYCILLFNNTLNRERYYDSPDWNNIILQKNASNVSFGNIGLIIITCICAVTFALAGFSYLHSKKKVDFYHSVPIRREVHFFVRYLNGILIFIIPYLFSLLLTFLIFQVQGYMNPIIFNSAMAAFFLNLIHFLLLYSVAVIALMLTGNIIVSVLVTGVLYAVPPLTYAVLRLHYGYFSTFISFNIAEVDVFAKTRFLSPFSMLVNNSIIYGSNNPYGDTPYKYTIPPLSDYAIMLALIVLFCLLALFLNQKRPLEKAGTAVIFRMAQPVLKFLTVIPGALLCGYVFASFNDSFGFYLFGVFLGIFILTAIIETIYHFDVKKLFAHKLELVLISLVCIFAGISFRFDLFGYNSYLPEKEELKSVGISINIGGPYFYIEMDEDELEGSPFTYRGREEYQLKYVNLTDIDLVYPLLQNGISYIETEYGTQDDVFSIAVKYVEKGGQTAYRQYRIPVTENKDLINEIMISREYYESAYPIYHIGEEYISEITLSRPDIGTEELFPSEELYELYKEDFAALTFDIIKDGDVKGELNFFASTGSNWGAYCMTYPIYASFTKTIAYLEDQGYSLKTEYYLDEIESVTITIFPNDEEARTIPSAQESITIQYTEKSEIEALLPYVRPLYHRSYQYNYFNHGYDISNRSEVTIHYNTNILNNGSYYVLKEIPKFLEDDFMKQ